MDVEGKLTAAPEMITGCTQQEVELQMSKVSYDVLLCNSGPFDDCIMAL